MEEFIIQGRGREIYGRLYVPSGDAKHPAVIMSHGYNGSYSDWEMEASYYSSHGYVVYTYDFCGGSANSKSSSTDMTITSEKEDLLSVFSCIRQLDCVDTSGIILFGGSQGGLVSSLAAAQLGDEVRALAMYFPALCVPDNWKEKYPDPAQAPDRFDFWNHELTRRFVEDVHELDVFGRIGDYKGPVLILHGDADDIVPYGFSEKAAEVYEHAELVRMEGEGHGFTPEGGEKAMQIVLEFLENAAKQS